MIHKVTVRFNNPEIDRVWSVMEIIVPGNGTVILRLTDKSTVTLSLSSVAYWLQEN